MSFYLYRIGPLARPVLIVMVDCSINQWLIGVGWYEADHSMKWQVGNVSLLQINCRLVSHNFGNLPV